MYAARVALGKKIRNGCEKRQHVTLFTPSCVVVTLCCNLGKPKIMNSVVLWVLARPALLTRATLLRQSLVTMGSGSVINLQAAVAVADDTTDILMARFRDPSPKQLSASFTDALASSFNRVDNLIFPDWMEGTWILTSRPIANAAPLGRRFLPADLARMRLGDLRNASSATPLRYAVRFVRRASDGLVVSDRVANLRAVQDAAAGFSRVEAVDFDGSGKLSVRYSPFGRNGTYPGPSRAEIYINWKRQAPPSSVVDSFVFTEATRTVFLASQRELSTISDAETLCAFQRQADGSIVGRQRVLRYLTPNPNSAEGILWGEANGRAVAALEYEFHLQRSNAQP